MKRVLKWSIPVDDRDHPLGSGPVVLVACDEPGCVTLWTEETEESYGTIHIRRARVYGTGQAVPLADTHLGSVRHEKTGLVWHVFGMAP